MNGIIGTITVWMSRFNSQRIVLNLLINFRDELYAWNFHRKFNDFNKESWAENE